MRTTSNHVPCDEWESIEYPLIVSNLKFSRDDLVLPEDTKVEIWRDENYQLKGKIYGTDFYSRTLNRHEFIGKGNIVLDDEIIGTDINRRSVKIHGCYIGNLLNRDTYKYDGNKQILEASFHMDSVTVTAQNQETHTKQQKRFDWYLIGDLNVFFDRTTFRLHDNDKQYLKARRGIDEYSDNTPTHWGQSYSKDHTLLKCSECNCIIAKIPDAYTPTGFKGICFEFRDLDAQTITEQTLKQLKYFTSMLLGGELHYIGYSILHDNTLHEAYLNTSSKPWEANTSSPPVRFTMHYEWGKFWVLVNELFPRYVELAHPLNLNDVIDRYWTAKTLPVGSSLPVLSSSLEILAASYLKMTGNSKLNYLPKEEYELKTQTEIESIKKKLSPIKGHEIIIRKLKGAYQKGPNEKMRLFFDLLNLKISEEESNAINLRNKMAHGSRDYSNIDTAHDDTISTHVYEILLTRALLRVLGYVGGYRDYSLKNSPSKHIRLGGGEK